MPGISAKVLTERLCKLEEAGLVLRVHEPTIPPKVTYSLTTRGHQLHEPLGRLKELAAEWMQPRKADFKPITPEPLPARGDRGEGGVSN